MERFVCIHGHFYQPPRENPWLEEVEMQDSAYPYHDWNQRITAECYAPNTASRILSPEGKIIDIVNNYSKISFNFGPTLLSWLEKSENDTYRGILEADRLSMERFSGHGSAMAQVYNHIILPLANDRDKETQVKWGIRDFEHRFGRFPEGLWLAETAVDIPTLEVLAENGISFALLAPRQAKEVRKMAEGEKWKDVSDASADPTMAYMCSLPSGRTISLFFYDGPISQSIAFGGLLNNGRKLADNLLGAFNDMRSHNQLVHIATDGESYGHHHRNGDMALAYCLQYIEANNLARITNYGEYLANNPPQFEAHIVENSSWSCGHGVERWRDNCGCNSGRPGWHQEWRKPLRETLNFLRDEAATIFEKHGSQYLKDPWQARNDYIEVILDRSPENIENFLEKHALKKLSAKEKTKVLKLLEMQRNSLLMYTSCGWFFDEVSGLETVQIIQYASIVIQYAGEFSENNLEESFLARFEKIKSNIHENVNYIYENYVKPTRLDLTRVSAHYAISSIFENYLEDTNIGAYTAHKEIFNLAEAGKLKLATGKLKIISDLTWEEETFSFAVLHLGDNNISCGVQRFENDEHLQLMENDIHGAFSRGDVAEVIRQISDYFADHNYSLYHLFKDQQRKILNQILQITYENIDSSYRQIYENNYSIMSFFQSLNIPLPKPLLYAAEDIINKDFGRIFENEDFSTEHLENLINDARRWPIVLEKDLIKYIAGNWIFKCLGEITGNKESAGKLQEIEKVLELFGSIDIRLRSWKSQNLYFSLAKEIYPEMQAKADQGEPDSVEWVNTFNRIGEYLKIDISELD
jgi:alpha-amylase/alpha-mannosidase (GH57 family)